MMIFLARPYRGAGDDPNKPAPYEKEVRRIKRALRKEFPYAKIFDPWKVYIKDRQHCFSRSDPKGIERGKDIYRRGLEIAAAADLVVAFLPRRSMGSADEISAASRNGRLVICICPLVENVCPVDEAVCPDCKTDRRVDNWTVLTHSRNRENIYQSLDDFVKDVKNGEILRRIGQQPGRYVDQEMVKKPPRQAAS